MDEILKESWSEFDKQYRFAIEGYIIIITYILMFCDINKLSVILQTLQLRL